MVDVANNRHPDQDDGSAHEQSCDYQTFHVVPHSTGCDKLATLLVRRKSHKFPWPHRPLAMAAEPIVCGQDLHM